MISSRRILEDFCQPKMTSVESCPFSQFDPFTNRHPVRDRKSNISNQKKPVDFDYLGSLVHDLVDRHFILVHNLDCSGVVIHVPCWREMPINLGSRELERAKRERARNCDVGKERIVVNVSRYHRNWFPCTVLLLLCTAEDGNLAIIGSDWNGARTPTRNNTDESAPFRQFGWLPFHQAASARETILAPKQEPAQQHPKNQNRNSAQVGVSLGRAVVAQ